MPLLITYMFIFLIGAISGWMIEVIYRRFFGAARRWINPGFLSGPFLPIYGTGFCLLYWICQIPMALPLRLIAFGGMATAVEYVTGSFFLRKYKIRLWDYTRKRFNLHGHITPLYTVFWILLSYGYFKFLYPFFNTQLKDLNHRQDLILILGILYGILIIDVANSFDFMNRLLAIKQTIGESSVIINLDRFKEVMGSHINGLHDRVEVIGQIITHRVDTLKDHRPRSFFLLPFRQKEHLKNYLKAYIHKMRPKG